METVQASVSGKQQTGPSGRRWALKLGVFAIFVICIGVFSYILMRNGSYSVETSLLYISGHEVAGEAAKLSLSQEIHLLKTPQISFSSCWRNLRVRPSCRHRTGETGSGKSRR